MWKKIFFIVLTLTSLASFIANFAYIESKLPTDQPLSDLPVTKLVLIKTERRLMVYSGDKLLKTYRVALGKNPLGHKEFEGDMKTPEGNYIINDKNPHSSYYKNLGISYPNEDDIRHSEKFGKSAGGLIKIHGLPNNFSGVGHLHYLKDWTQGCVAVTNEEIDELFENVPVGTPIEIKP